MKTLSILLAALMLSACASSKTTDTSDQKGAQGTVAQAATTPLTDLNLERGEIPPVLLEARKQPYAMPADVSCAALTAAVKDLDEVLGPDIDAAPDGDDDSGGIGGAASGAIKGMAEGLVPFRGWVRKLSGAERHARKVADSIHAGAVRRAFLKGLGQAAGCQLVAAPKATQQEQKK